MTSPAFPATASESYVEFAYHMLGSGIGTLELQYLRGGDWWRRWSRRGAEGPVVTVLSACFHHGFCSRRTRGSQEDAWQQAKVTLPTGTEALRFLSSGAVSSECMVAVDSVVGWQPAQSTARGPWSGMA